MYLSNVLASWLRRSEVRTRTVLGIVVAVHGIAVGSLVCLQGCRPSSTASGTVSETPPPVMMPPTVASASTSTGPGPTTASVSSAMLPFTTTYVVSKGDSLSVIAKKFGVRTRDIADLNQLKNPNKIRAGQKLLLPGTVDVSKPRAVRAGRSAPKAGPNQYVVKKGDTLSHIAKRHGTTTRALREANKLTSDLIRVNDVLALPRGSGARPVTRVASTTSTPSAPQAAGTKQAAAVTPELEDDPQPVELEPVPELPPMPAVVEAPPDPVVEEAVATEPAAEEDTGGEFLVHVVAKDEDVFDVALRYTVLPDEVRRLNNLEGNELQEGQRLKIKVSGIPE